MTRPLSELLPIARRRLITAENRSFGFRERDEFTCIAAQYARDHGEMTSPEYAALRAAIMDELYLQGGPDFKSSTLFGVLAHLGVIDESQPGMDSHLPAYIPLRDRWLDALQVKFETEETFA